MRSALTLIAVGFFALSAAADPLICSSGDDDTPASMASPEVCSIIEDEEPDEAYGWSMNRGRATEFDQFVLIMRFADWWEVRGYVSHHTEAESEILLEQPKDMPALDVGFWETFGTDDNALLTEVITKRRFQTDLPPSVGLKLRDKVDAERRRQLETSITLDDYYANDGSICVSHHILNVYLVSEGEAVTGLRWGCGYLTEMDKFTNDINDALIELGLVTLYDVEYVSVRPSQENDE